MDDDDDIERREFRSREEVFLYCMRARGIKPDTPDWVRLREVFEARTEAMKALVDDLEMRLRPTRIGGK